MRGRGIGLRATGLLVGTLLLAPAGATAQEQGMSGEEAVLATVHELFDAMRDKDADRLRAVFHPDAVLLSVTSRDGEGALGRTPIDRFIESVSTATAYLDEEIWDEEVRIDGALATVWTPYRMIVDGTLSHCGVDAFQLLRTNEGWKIIHIADTRRREGCEGG